MTGQRRDVEEVLSRVFHTTTDQVEPVGDGLTKIRGRLAEPWLKRQWWLLRSELMMLRWLVVVRCESFFSTLRSGEAGAGAGAGGRLGSLPVLGGIIAWAFAKGGRPDGSRRSSGAVLNWLRPAMAVAGAVVLVVVGVFALGQIRAGFVGLSTSGSENPPGTSSQGGGNVGLNGHGSRSAQGHPRRSAGHSAGAKRGVSHHIGPHASASPCSSPSPSPAGQPTPSPSPPPSPTPSPTVSPTTSPTATSSPTASSSQAPLSALHAVKDRAAHGTRTTALVCVPVNPSPSGQASPA
jgi:hypothetical protein